MLRIRLHHGLILILPFLLNACIDNLNEISFISFQANFEAPANIRVKEEISLQPGESTTGAISQEWKVLELDTNIQGANFQFSFDSIGSYTIRLISTIQKNVGLVKDSSDKSILVLPTTDSLLSSQELGEFPEDESLQDVLKLPGDRGFFLLGRKNVNILELRRLDSQGQELWRSEFPNLTRGRIQGQNIQLVADTALIIVGLIQTGTLENDAFILELDFNDIEQRASVRWQEIIASVENELYTSVVEDSSEENSSYYAIGTASSSGQSTLLIDEYSTDGELIRTETFESVCGSCTSNQAILIPEGDEPVLIVAGQEVDNPAIFEFVLGDEGLELRNRTILNQIQGEAQKIMRLSDGKFALVGSANLGGNDSTQAFIAKLDVISSSVVPAWISRVSFYQDRFEDIQEVENGDLLAIGTHFNPLSGQDILLGRFDTFSGEAIFTRLLGGNFNESALRLQAQGNRWFGFGQIGNNTFLDFSDIQVSEIPVN